MDSDKVVGFFGVVGIVVAVLFLLAGLGLLLAFPIKWCWNYTMPELFALPTITWGKAWCLHFLACMFLKSTNCNSGKG